ncbi:DNA-processing protein DprA [Parasphingorhabdus marina]
MDVESGEPFDRLRLIRSSNVGPVSYYRLLKEFGTAKRALEALPDLARGGGRRRPEIASAETVAREIESVQQVGGKYLFHDDPDYPAILSELRNAPPVLIWRGNISLLQNPSVAVVGARNASAASRSFARQLANELSEQGMTVVSGLARGIDTAAHEGSIQHGPVAVIAGGTDVYFPPENQALQERIAETGLLLSEQPPGTEPHARHFPFRNRIIAGLATGALVIEAAPRSGSLITARLAAESGRQVMAVPGSPMDPRSQGCNSLIREGASLIQSAEDVLELIRPIDERMSRPMPSEPQSRTKPAASPIDRPLVATNRQDQEAKIIDLLSATPVTVDELIRQSHLDPSDIQLILLELELAGKLTRSAGARVALSRLH